MSAASTALLRACSLLLCLVAGSRQFSIKEFVVPKTVLVGEKAELRCQYELTPEENEAALYVKWWWTPATSSSKYDRKQIYQRIAGLEPESIPHVNSSKIEIKPNDTIVLTEVSPVDSGVYECEVSNIEEIRKHDTLVVYSLGTGPVLGISEIEYSKKNEHTYLLIECEAEDVAPEPFFVVTLDSKEINMTSSYTEDDDHDGLYTIYSNVTLPIEDTDPKEVKCEMFYKDDSVSHPPSVEIKTYVPEGCDSQSTTEMPEDTTQPESTPESLQNPRDDGVRLHCSWVLLVTAVALAQLQSIL